MIQEHIKKGIRWISNNKLFVGVLALKLAMLSTVGSRYPVRLFIPFVNYFIGSGFANPYEHFYRVGPDNAFPYSGGMLYPLTFFSFVQNLFFAQGGWEPVGLVSLAVLRIPVLLSDLVILLILMRWLPNRAQDVVRYYWASPILIYINYFHGQLDAIPVALLFGSLYFIFKKRYLLGFGILGTAVSAKMSVLAALPFLVLYLWKQRSGFRRVCIGLSVVYLVNLLLAAPFLTSRGFWEMVIKAHEQGRIFLVSLPFNFAGLGLLILPAGMLVLILQFSSYKFISRDLLLMYLGIGFLLLVAFLPPMPGWFYWSVPFLTYFFAKFPESHKLAFATSNFFFMLYFLLRPDSDIFESFQLVSTKLSGLITPYEWMLSYGVDASLVTKVVFSLLDASLLMCAYWVYKTAIKKHLEYRSLSRPIMVGVSGDSGSGKTVLASVLVSLVGSEDSVRLAGDDLHKWERGDSNWQYFTHLDPNGNRLALDVDHAVALKHGKHIERVSYDHETGKFRKGVRLNPQTFVFFEGLHTLFIQRMRSMLDLKIYLDPEQDLKLQWKLERDTQKRGYSKNVVMQMIKKRSADLARYVETQRHYADLVFSFSKSKRGENGLALKVNFDNSFNANEFEILFGQLRTISVFHSYDDNLATQTFLFEGSITSNEIAQVSYSVIPDIDEVFDGELNWEGGYNGLCQLMFMFCLSEKHRWRELEWAGR